MRIGVTFDLRSDYLAMGYDEEETAEFDSEITVSALCTALAGLGYVPERIGGVVKFAECLARGERWDGVFNICEGLKGVSREAQVPALLEAFDIPYVFSDPLTLSLTLDKAMCKRVVRDCGIPTADFAVIDNIGDADRVMLDYPLFLKPVAEGSGKGIDGESKVEDAQAMKRCAAKLLRKFNQPVLVETFLPGREFTVGITGTGDDAQVLGVSEIVKRRTMSATATDSRIRNIGRTKSISSVRRKRIRGWRAKSHLRRGVACAVGTAVASIYVAMRRDRHSSWR